MTTQTMPTSDFPVMFRNVAPAELLIEYARAYKAEREMPERKRRRCHRFAPKVANATGIHLKLIPSSAVHQCFNQHDYLLYAALFCSIAHVYARLDHFLQKRDPTDFPQQMFEPLIKRAGHYMEVLATLGCDKTREEIDIWKSDLQDKTITPDWGAAARRTQTLLYNCFLDKYAGQIRGHGAMVMRGNAEKLLIDRWLQDVWNKCEFGTGTSITAIDTTTGKIMRPRMGALKESPTIKPTHIKSLSEMTTQAVMISDITALIERQQAIAVYKRSLESSRIEKAQRDVEVGWHRQLADRVTAVGYRIFGLEGDKATYANLRRISVEFRTGRLREEGLPEFLVRHGLRRERN